MLQVFMITNAEFTIEKALFRSKAGGPPPWQAKKVSFAVSFNVDVIMASILAPSTSGGGTRSYTKAGAWANPTSKQLNKTRVTAGQHPLLHKFAIH